MDTTTAVVVGFLVLVLLFFGFTMISANNNYGAGAGNTYGNYPSGGYPSGQVGGGGCGR